MRKWIVLLLLFFVACFGAVYFLIPNTITVKKEARIGANAKAFTRTFLHEAAGTPWLQKAEGTSPDAQFIFSGNNYALLERKMTSLLFSVNQGGDTMLTEVVVIPFQPDSVALSFIGVTRTGWNPIDRIQKRIWAKKIASDMTTLLTKLQTFYSETANVYGFHISKEFVVDTALISTSATLNHYPETTDVYTMVDRLKAYAGKNKAGITGSPMLNVTPTADSTYITRVALPLDKIVPNEGEIHYKWMMGGGNILKTDVKGGPATIRQAYAATFKYVNDNGWATAAIPYESLVTDRRAEPDTNKWITKIYWPVR